MEKNSNKGKAYISTPITGQDMMAVRVWVSCAKEILAKNGYIPVSPLDVNSNLNASYSVRMGKDIQALLECDAVYFLRGWSDSNGCQLEYAAAKIYNKKIMFE